MRLTADLVKESLSYLNPLKERELDLRGHRIPAIENLGVAGPHDAMDFTDNDIQVLGNFPLSPRITTLLLGRNRISHIQPTLATTIPYLRNLVLGSNRFAELADLDSLSKFKLLVHLVLMDNPVTKKEHYRYWVIWRCPGVRFLDYQKVRDAERQRARELFGTAKEPTELASTIMRVKSRSGDIISTAAADNGSGGPTSKLGRMNLTDAEKDRLKEMIKNSQSLEEIIRLERHLNEGRLPPGFTLDPDTVPMEE